MKKNIFQIVGLFLLLPLFAGCNDTDDVAAIFTGKTWKLNYITVDGGHEMFGFWENEAEKKKSIEELNKNGTYNVIFEGVAEGDLISGKIRGTVVASYSLAGTWSANGKNNDFNANITEGNDGGDKASYKASTMRHRMKGIIKTYTFYISLPEANKLSVWFSV